MKQLTVTYMGGFDRIYDEEGIAKSLEKLDVNVVRIPDKLTNVNFSEACKMIPRSTDFVLCPKWEFQGAKSLQKELKRHNIPTVTWHPDLFYNLPLQRHESIFVPFTQRHAAYTTDIVCTPEGGIAHKRYRELGINHHILRQGIYEDCCYMAPPDNITYYHDNKLSKNYDILFVGGSVHQYHQYRKPLIRHLKETYNDRFLHVGSPCEVNNRVVSNEHQYRMDDLNKLISNCKIIIGESVEQEYYWSNRLYETIGRGGFCLHAYTKGIEEEFTPEEHFDVFERNNNFKDLDNKINKYLTDKALRVAVAQAGFKYLKERYTLYNRCKEFVNILLKYNER